MITFTRDVDIVAEHLTSDLFSSNIEADGQGAGLAFADFERYEKRRLLGRTLDAVVIKKRPVGRF